MPLTLTVETLDQARAAGLDDHLQLHWEEVEDDQAQAPLAINWRAYYDLERAGVLKVLALRRDGALIGYSIWFVQPTLQHMNTVWGICDLLYVDPAHRGAAGLFLIRKGEALLQAMGVKAMIYNVKPPGDLGAQRGRGSVAPLLARLGYTMSEQSWVKYV